MLCAWPGRQVGATFPDQLEREIWPQTVDLSEVHAKDGMEGRAGVKRGCIGLASPWPNGKQLALRWRGGLLQPCQDCLDLLIAGRHLGLIDVIKFERLGQGEGMLL